jgi:predicted nucleic acid-binding protein
MAERVKVYLDSCCFIDMAKQSIGLLPTARNQDVWYCWKLLEANRDKEIDVITSVLTIAECTHAAGNTDTKVKDLFTRVLMSGQFVQLVQPTPFIAADARDLRWQHGLTLRGADALHVASAIFLKASDFLTTDDKILNSKTAIGVLGLQVRAPAKTSCLPVRYRQEEIFNDKITVLKTGRATPNPA